MPHVLKLIEIAIPEVDFQVYNNSAEYVSPVLLDAKQVALGEKALSHLSLMLTNGTIWH